MNFRILIIVIYIITLTSCSKNIVQLAKEHQFQSKYIQTSSFKIRSFEKINSHNSVNIYIEGDGRGRDPSPVISTTFELATIDSNPNVIYLARPCQLSPSDLQSVCTSYDWQQGRYSKKIISSISEVLDQYKFKKINLIGFSGGGAIAVLVAAQRNDISSIKTVAGNLDLIEMDRYHKTIPLTGSLDPMSVATKINHIPQLHFSGSEDQIVPLQVTKNYVAKSNSDKVKYIIVKAKHNSGWYKIWPELLKEKI